MQAEQTEQTLLFNPETTDIDSHWHLIAQLKDITGHLRCPLLSKLAKSVLIIPHGKADVQSTWSERNEDSKQLIWAQTP